MNNGAESSDQSVEGKGSAVAGGLIERVPQRRGAELEEYLEWILAVPRVEPWPEPVNGAELLEEVRQKISSHVVLPKWAAETMALWVPHTFAFSYRDSTGLERRHAPVCSCRDQPPAMLER